MINIMSSATKKTVSTDTHCPETGLLNRAAISEKFEKTILSDLQNMCLTLIEIDDFSAIEAKHSKRTLNAIISNFVTEINEVQKVNDTLVRWSSSEFLLVSPSSTHEESSVFSNRIRRVIQNSTWKKKLEITCSTGVTQMGAESLRVLMNQTKAQLAKLKVTGGNKSFIAKKHIKKKVLPQVEKTEVEINNNDALPDLLNRRAINLFINKTPPETLNKMSIITIKINNLAELSQQYGTPILNDISQKLITDLKNKSRSSDILGKWSEDQYILICPNSNIHYATDAAAQFKSSIQNRLWLQAIDIRCSTQAYDKGLNNLSTHINTEKPAENSVEDTIEHTSISTSGTDIETIETKKTDVITEDELDLDTMTCALTGALNQEGIRLFLTQTSPEAIAEMSVVFIEVNDFKQITEVHSEQVSNEMSKKFVNEINTNCSASGILTRWTSTEYLLICPKTTLEEASLLAVEIKTVMENKTWSNNISLTCNTEAYDQGWNDFASDSNNTLENEMNIENVSAA